MTTIPAALLLPAQLNRALDLSRHKHAFAQLRLAASPQKPEPTAAADAGALSASSPPGDNTHLQYVPCIMHQICLRVLSFKRPECTRYRMSQQRCSELEGKLQQLQQQHRLSMQSNPVSILETARAETIADLEQVAPPQLSSCCLSLFSL
jgi:hypothetical protein